MLTVASGWVFKMMGLCYPLSFGSCCMEELGNCEARRTRTGYVLGMGTPGYVSIIFFFFEKKLGTVWVRLDMALGTRFIKTTSF